MSFRVVSRPSCRSHCLPGLPRLRPACHRKDLPPTPQIAWNISMHVFLGSARLCTAKRRLGGATVPGCSQRSVGYGIFKRSYWLGATLTGPTGGGLWIRPGRPAVCTLTPGTCTPWCVLRLKFTSIPSVLPSFPFGSGFGFDCCSASFG